MKRDKIFCNVLENSRVVLNKMDATFKKGESVKLSNWDLNSC